MSLMSDMFIQQEKNFGGFSSIHIDMPYIIVARSTVKFHWVGFKIEQADYDDSSMIAVYGDKNGFLMAGKYNSGYKYGDKSTSAFGSWYTVYNETFDQELSLDVIQEMLKNMTGETSDKIKYCRLPDAVTTTTMTPPEQHVRIITIDNTNNSNDLTNYQVKIRINYDSSMNNDFSDIRFYDSDDSTKLPYWIEEKVDGNYADVWVKVPKIPANSTKEIYLHYGDSSATSESNGEDVFEFFDDFSSLDKWTILSGTWTTTTVDGKTAVFCDNDNGGHVAIKADFSQMENQIIEVEVKATAFGINREIHLYPSIYDMDNRWLERTIWRSDHWEGEWGKRISGSWSEGDINTNWAGMSLNVWYSYKLVQVGDTASLYVDDEKVGSKTDTDVYGTISNAKVGIGTSTIDAYFTNFRVRKYTDPEPTTTVSNEIPSWWDTNWEHRQAILIDNTSNTSTLTDYQILITVNYDSNMNSDFSDLRFIDSDNSTELPYWIEEKVDGSYAKVWVKVPQISGSSYKKIYMYYGNPSATNESNPDDVFELYDDFEGTSLDTSKWTIAHNGYGTYSYSVANSYLHINARYDSGCCTTSGVTLYSNKIFSKDDGEFILEAYSKQYFITNGGKLYFQNRFVDSLDDNKMVYYASILYHDSLWRPYTICGSNPTDRVCNESSVTTEQSYNKFHSSKLIYRMNNAIGIDSEPNSHVSIDLVIWNGTEFKVGLFFGAGTDLHHSVSEGETYVDYIILRKYTDPEPTYTIDTTVESLTITTTSIDYDENIEHPPTEITAVFPAFKNYTLSDIYLVGDSLTFFTKNVSSENITLNNKKTKITYTFSLTTTLPITDYGREQIWLSLFETLNVPTHVAYGYNTSTPTQTTTSLDTEYERNSCTITEYSRNEARYQSILELSEANGNTINIEGLFDSSSGGNLWLVRNHPEIEKSDLITIQSEFYIQIV